MSTELCKNEDSKMLLFKNFTMRPSQFHKAGIETYCRNEKTLFQKVKIQIQLLMISNF